MSVCKMKKLTVLAHKRDTDALLSRLMRLRAVELRQEEGEELTPVFSDLQGKRAELERKIQAVDSALSALRKYGKKKGLGAKPIPLDLDAFSKNSSNKQAEELVNEALSLESEKAKSISDTALSQTKLASLEAWRDYDLELGFSGTEKTEVILGSLPGGTELSRIDGEIAEYGGFAEIVNDSDTTCLLSVTYLRENEADVMRGLTRLGFVKASFEDSATAKEAIGRTKARLREIEIRLEKIDDRLKKIAESTDLIECYYDLLVTSARQSEAKMQLMGTENCTVLCGWVPEQRQETVERALSKFECAYEMTDPDEEDEPPVLLKNNPISRSFEWVMGMYAYPKYGTYDPTVIMSLFYVIIFGLMFADVGYGAILVVACFGGILLLNPREGMRNFLAMFGYCGIFCIIGGILFGAYFGNIPQAFMENMMGIEGATTNVNLAVILDPIQDPMGFLIISLGTGAVHMVAGMAVQFYVLCKKGQWVDALCDIPTWWLFFAGLGLTFLFPWGKYVAIAGALSLIVTQGRHEKSIFMKIFKGVGSLYGTINYAADLLSYSRILALGLAASVIGQVVNTMSTMAGPSVVGFIMMVAIFTFGHLLNLAINVLGTFVHTSRLQYIEFFGKFFEDGGVPFAPLKPSDKYTTDK